MFPIWRYDIVDFTEKLYLFCALVCLDIFGNHLLHVSYIWTFSLLSIKTFNTCGIWSDLYIWQNLHNSNLIISLNNKIPFSLNLKVILCLLFTFIIIWMTLFVYIPINQCFFCISYFPIQVLHMIYYYVYNYNTIVLDCQVVALHWPVVFYIFAV